MRRWLLILGLGYGIACYAQQDTINQRSHGHKEGYWVKQRRNGTLEWEGHFVKGKRTGHWKFYDQEGRSHSEGQLVNGERIGAWYVVETRTGRKLDMTRWNGKGRCVGGATLSW